MGNALNPGNMQAAPDPANQIPTDFEASMASAIENAFLALLQQDSMRTFTVDTNSSDARDRRRLLIAIAQGVTSHLIANAAAFQVSGTDSLGKPIAASLTINAGNTLLSGI
jgi:predicted lactoylglutathione lyase